MTDDATLDKTLTTLLQNGIAPSTRRAYAEDRARFWAWAKTELGITEAYPIPIQIILQYIVRHLPQTGETGPKVASLKRYVSSLAVANQQHGGPSLLQDPQIRLLFKRARRALPNQAPVRKVATTTPVLRALIATCDDSLWDRRDKAILLLGFAAGGRRRAELAKLNVSDLIPTADGYLVHIRHSKTDQDGQGLTVPLVDEPAAALRAWLSASGITEGFVFRGIRRNGTLNTAITGKTISHIVQKRARLAGFDPKAFGGHSLRAGFLTEAVNQGVPLLQAMQFTGHKTLSVAQGYDRNAELQQDRAARLFQLDKKKEK